MACLTMQCWALSRNGKKRRRAFAQWVRVVDLFLYRTMYEVTLWKNWRCIIFYRIVKKNQDYFQYMPINTPINPLLY